MRTAVWTSVLMMLTGCSSGDLEKHSTSFAAHTEKAPLKYIRCLEPKWQLLNTTTSVVETKTGYTLNVSEYHIGQIALAVISEEKDGPHVEVFLPAALGKAQGWKDAAGSCL